MGFISLTATVSLIFLVVGVTGVVWGNELRMPNEGNKGLENFSKLSKSNNKHYTMFARDRPFLQE